MFRHTALTLTLLSAAVLVGCDGGKDADTASYDNAGMTALEEAIHDAINDHRESIGLMRLAPNTVILAESRGHSDNMMSGAVPFSHDGFEDRAAVIGEAIPIQSAGENVAYLNGMPDPVAAAVEGWLNSPDHRANIEGNFNITGLGATEQGSEIYLTQIFALSL